MNSSTIRSWCKKIVLWSWVITLPIVVVGGHTLFQTWKRFDTFFVRYDPSHMKGNLSRLLEYQIGNVTGKIASVITPTPSTELPTIRLSAERRALATLHQHMPQSGFEYVKGTLLYGDKPRRVKIRYRGDFAYHWAYEKKSIRVKTKKDDLFQGMRAFNLQAPKFKEQINNYLGYQLAEQMGLLGPKSELVRVMINGEDRGVHIMVEQLEELTLRRNAKMPGDIYRGEIVAKDRFRGIGDMGGNLFEHPGFWDKVAINNHYPDASAKPLEAMVELVQAPDRMQAQAKLEDLLDMEAWGKFSAYESLAGTYHFHPNHNWRIYYDPWRQNLVPIVWDPVGWPKGWREPASSPTALNPVIQTDLQKMLFKNGAFLKAREAALEEFFASGKAERFLAYKDNAVATLNSELETDRFLNPQDPELIKSEVEAASVYIDRIFADAQILHEKSASHITYAETGQGIRLSVGGQNSVKRVMFKFPNDIDGMADLIVKYRTRTAQKKSVTHSVDMQPAVSLSGSELTLNAAMVPNSSFTKPGLLKFKNGLKLDYSAGIYDINFDVNQVPTSVWVDLGSGWKRISRVDRLKSTAFDNIFEPINHPLSTKPVVWSGVKEISGVETIEQPLIIEPGTIIKLAENASVIMKNQVTAVGTKDRPISFQRADGAENPWGAIGLQGRGADGSKFAHCSFVGGSGYKGDLFEFSALFSAHDVRDLIVEDCEFADGTVVDDMVHIVYSTAEFTRTVFRNSFSDAFDIDISEAKISDSRFENSGNDAVDLMSSIASIDNTQFIDSGDKGISVGEGSYLLGVNNTLVNNEIGVQSKDGSNAFLYNHSFMGNRQALHAYKKNWRYGAGGEILLFKSKLVDNDKNVTAERKSKIQVFDSYADTPVTVTNRVSAFAVDGESESAARHEGRLVPQGMKLNQRNAALIQRFDQSVMQLRDVGRRGAM
ncbi:CotH kinase family protein [uncultured Roseovarius sp.]|uniref:CotH kinase family protein n=1 Tax=uncultured Roseovarius sp. TaxID=293344 RepID=UPI00261063EB|nr:CotH kinase family protein [uncultured Roseovarius sp.]